MPPSSRHGRPNARFANLYGPKAAARSVSATVVGNVRVTEVGKDYDTHHIVLDFGAMPFPVLEGQSIGIVPPGVDADGRPHFPRQYSVASPRNGERPGYNNVSLTVKRVLEDHQGRPVRGVASNYLCDLKVGDKVEVTGPFGVSFLMPNHPQSAIVMICTGTGSAPMRAMTEWRRRLRKSGKFDGGKLMLFFGARTKEELPYFGPLVNLPKDFIDINFAFSRTPGEPKRYVQDVMRERAADLAPLIADPDAYFYVCGLKAMEEGVVTRASRHRDQGRARLGDPRAGAQARRAAASGNLLTRLTHEEKPMSAEDILSDCGRSDERRPLRRNQLRRRHSQQRRPWLRQAASARARGLAAEISRLVERHGPGRLPAVRGLSAHRRRRRPRRLGQVRLCEDADLSLGHPARAQGRGAHDPVRPP